MENKQNMQGTPIQHTINAAPNVPTALFSPKYYDQIPHCNTFKLGYRSTLHVSVMYSR
jgi:hypothetical protein